MNGGTGTAGKKKEVRMKRVPVLSIMILSALSWIWTGCYTTFPIAGRADAASADPYMDDMEYDSDVYYGGPGLVVDEVGDHHVYVEPGLCINVHIGNSWAVYPYRSWSGVHFTWTNYGWLWDPRPVFIRPFWFEYPRLLIYPFAWRPYPHPWNDWHDRHWDHNWAFHRHDGPGWNFHGKHHSDWSHDYRQPVLERRSFDRRPEYAAVSARNRISRRTSDAGRHETSVVPGGGRDPSGAGMGSGRTGRTGTRQTSVRAAGNVTPATEMEPLRAVRSGMTRDVQAQNIRKDQNTDGQEKVHSTDLRTTVRELRSVSNEDAASSSRPGLERQSRIQGKNQPASEQMMQSAAAVKAEQKSRLQEARQTAGRRTETRQAVQPAERKPESRQAVQTTERKPESRQAGRAGSGRQENQVRSAAPAPGTSESQRTQVSSGKSGDSGNRTEPRSRTAIRGRQ